MHAKLQCLLFPILSICVCRVYLSWMSFFSHVGSTVGSTAAGVENSVDNELVKEAAKGVKEGASQANGLLKK